MLPSISKLFIIGVLLSLSVATAARADAVETFDDIDFWIGTGANSAAIAIDWDSDSSTDTALTWGYRWDGLASVETALRAVLQADRRLYAKLSANSGFGIATYGFGYDENNDQQFALNDNTIFDASGIAISNPSDSAESTDAADFYAEGWDSGFWHLATTIENPLSGNTWTSAPFGVSGVSLNDNQWSSLAFTTDTFSTTAVAENLRAAPSPFVPGDFQPDGKVDELDFAIWQAGFGLDNVNQELGDADDDRDVDGNDFLLWQRNYSPATTETLVARPVPEPTTAGLIACGFIFLNVFLIPFNRRSL